MNQEEKFAELIKSVPWRFAKTFMNLPHEYTIFPRELLDDFYEMYLYIAANGYTEHICGRDFQYINIGHHKFWSMMTPTTPKERMTVMNRTLIDNSLLDAFKAKYKKAADLPAGFTLESLLKNA